MRSRVVQQQFRHLQQGKVDCVVIDQEPAKAFVEANDGIEDSGYRSMQTEDYAAAVSKKNPELTAGTEQSTSGAER